ncbi:MAG: N-acetyltransferase [Gammaproteobacteria bacterium]|nr:N-acetyltransferase [Gammaproteobacteria bacterium]
MIRRAHADDLEGLMALERRCFGPHEGLFQRRQIRRLLASATAAWFVYGDYWGACCMLIGANGRARWGRLYSLAVDPAHREKGIGRALVLAGLDWLAAHHIDQCRAEVKAGNEPARRLYASLGFVEAGGLPHYYGIGGHGLRLAKTLRGAP